jgi:hypothetical protein
MAEVIYDERGAGIYVGGDDNPVSPRTFQRWRQRGVVTTAKIVAPCGGVKRAGRDVGRRLANRRWTARPSRIDFGAVNRAAMLVLPVLFARWLPGGRNQGAEFVALNPRRADRRPGSFKVNLNSGHWADFAVGGAAGGDPVSLAAYLAGISQTEAARRLTVTLGLETRDVG